ncbi:MAG: hypothetical protein AABX79_02400, partial [Nanoarchaeota archaeon]
SSRSLSFSEIVDISKKTGHDVSSDGRMGPHSNWHYSLRQERTELTEEGLMCLVEKGFKIVSLNERYDSLMAKFSNKK